MDAIDREVVVRAVMFGGHRYELLEGPQGVWTWRNYRGDVVGSRFASRALGYNWARAVAQGSKYIRVMEGVERV